MGRVSRVKGLFHRPKHNWIAKYITQEGITVAKENTSKLIKALERGKLGKLKIGRKRALAIARALREEANRLKAQLKRKDLKPETREKFKRLYEIYDSASDRAFTIYREEYKE